ncbi:hypothetical protein SNOG_02746 [Parastagonospora nodorum SN15]|uniref:Uncharacterized protein n=1 Tax=Phaeosphaeria nodorum (strain SN15 / ATCC MYA-4574 / FGSC 10173) TaxID=321614 RepID=Q0UZR8_PHANO|nr:hypothetical protein SNOG_02746 [Parastagonospora nodorum SN15]EAT89477.1 hypothetical protein SNOG_02746 [Parastagonospora nodorum SN15]
MAQTSVVSKCSPQGDKDAFSSPRLCVCWGARKTREHELLGLSSVSMPPFSNHSSPPSHAPTLHFSNAPVRKKVRYPGPTARSRFIDV